MKSTHSAILSMAILVAVTLACSASKQSSSGVTYQKDGFVVQELHDGGLAILPILAGQGMEGYRRPFGEYLYDAVVSDTLNNYSVTSWQSTMDVLNDNDLASTYADAIVTYHQTAVIDRGLVREIGAALKQRYLLFVHLDPFTNDSQLKRGVLTGNVVTQTKIGVSASALIWDTVSGDVVWEGFAESSVQNDELSTIKAEDRKPEVHSEIVAWEIMKQLFPSIQS